MENASKALIISGSVLLSVLIISILVFSYKKVIDLKRIESVSEETKKIYEYNKKMEMFNKAGLYGSELLSLSNLIDDYNRTQHELKEYEKIDLQVEIKQIPSAYYFKETNYSSCKEINKVVKQLSDDIKSLETVKLNKLYNNVRTKNILKNADINVNLNKLNNNKYSKLTLEKLSNLREKEKQTIFEGNEDALYVASTLTDFYSNIKAEFVQFKNKKFQQPKTEYNKGNSRITKMIYKEIGL